MIEVVRQKGDKVGNRIRISVTCLIALCLLAALLLAGTALGEVSREGLVGEWHFDGDAKDASGNGNDGIIYGATFMDGKFGKALSFDGVNDWVDLGDKFESYSAMTISTFFKTSDLISKDKMIVAKWGGEGQASWFIAQNGNTVRVHFRTDGGEATSWATTALLIDKWYHVVGVYDGNNVKIYLNGDLEAVNSLTGTIKNSNVNTRIGAEDRGSYFKGIIDEIRIYNRALSDSEVKANYEAGQTALTVIKTASPNSIKQGQTATITISVKNTGTTEIKDIEIKDTIPSDVIYVSGETTKTYSSLKPKDSREFQYILQINQAGTFNLGSAAATFADEKGNYQKTKSNAATLEVIPSLAAPTPTLVATTPEPASSAVLLHGEKTDVILGEDVLLKLSAVNLITKPHMTVQVMIYPPSGMSVTSSEFVKSGAGIYTTTYSLNPGDGKDIEVRIKTNQVGDFNVKGRIVYYFGDNQSTAEDHTLNLPIKVRKESELAQNEETPAQKTPGFGIIVSISVVLFIFLKKRDKGIIKHGLYR